MVLFLSLVDRAAGKRAASDCFSAVGTCVGSLGKGKEENMKGSVNECKNKCILGPGSPNLESAEALMGCVTVSVIYC